MPNIECLSSEDLRDVEALISADTKPVIRDMVIFAYLHLLEDEDVLSKFGEKRIAEISLGIVDRISYELGGCCFYLPKGISSRLSKRDISIVQEFNGRNVYELANKHSVSTIRIYQIIEKHRRSMNSRKKHQS
jgi:Mor family transcriptional regulator